MNGDFVLADLTELAVKIIMKRNKPERKCFPLVQNFLDRASSAEIEQERPGRGLGVRGSGLGCWQGLHMRHCLEEMVRAWT